MPRAETRLSEDQKKDWAQFCKASGMSEADMLRMMIQRVSGKPQSVGSAGLGEPKAGKVTIRLSRSDDQKLIQRAQTEGYRNRTNWTTSVVMAALHRESVLTDREVAALRESNRELAAIGRNLNQVARALNIEFRESDKLKQEAIEKLTGKIEQHKGQVAGLLFRNMNRWGNDDGQPS